MRRKRGIFIAILALTLASLAIVGHQVFVRYEYQLGMQFALHFEMPGFSASRTELPILTGGRYQQASLFLASQREVLAHLHFVTYVRSRMAFTPIIEKIERQGWSERKNPAWHPGRPFDWSADPNTDRNWRFRINALEHLDAYFHGLARTGDPRYYAIIEQAVFDWIDYNLVRDGRNDFKWYDMSAGIRAARLASLYYHGISRGELDEGELRLLLAAMDMHVEALKNPRYLNPGNHGLFQMNGLAAICHVARVLRSCDEAGPYARRAFQHLAEAQFTPEGMHAEHSSQYHPWAIRMIEEMLSFGYLGGIDTSFLDAAKANTIHWFYPDGEMHLLGDSGELHACRIRNIHPYVEFLCAGGEAGVAPAETFSWLPQSGYAIARSSWDVKPLSGQSFLFLNAAFHSQAHRHADDLSILWYDAGRPILVDSGKYTYDVDEWREYVKSTRAHNTVEVDESDFSMSPGDAYGSALKGYSRAGDAVLMIAEVAHRRPRVHQRRLVAFVPGKMLVVIDAMDGGWREHVYRQWFHFHESLQVALDGSSFEVIDQHGQPVASGVMYASAAEEPELVKGAVRPRIQGWISRRYKQKSPNFAMANKAVAREAVLVTALGVGAVSPSLDVEGSAVHLCMETVGLRIDLERETVQQFDCVPGRRPL